MLSLMQPDRQLKQQEWHIKRSSESCRRLSWNGKLKACENIGVNSVAARIKLKMGPEQIRYGETEYKFCAFGNVELQLGKYGG